MWGTVPIICVGMSMWHDFDDGSRRRPVTKYLRPPTRFIPLGEMVNATGLCIILCSFHFWKHMYGHVCHGVTHCHLAFQLQVLAECSTLTHTTLHGCLLWLLKALEALYVGYLIYNPKKPVDNLRYCTNSSSCMKSSNAHRWKCLAGEHSQITSCWGYRQYISCYWLPFRCHQNIPFTFCQQESCWNLKLGSCNRHFGMHENERLLSENR